MAKKTIEVEWLRERVNFVLARGDMRWVADKRPDQAYRMALASLLEAVLNDTGNYHGFGYQGSEIDDDHELKPDYDDSRRVYY